MKRSYAFAFALAVPAVLVLAGCSSSGSTSNAGSSGSPSGNTSKSITIGFSNSTQQSPFYVALGDAIKAEAKKLHAKVDYVNANGDINTQNQGIQDLITKGINVLIVDPVDPKGIAPSVAAAKAAKIPIITVDQPANNVKTFVGRNNVEMSTEIGKQVASALGPKGGTVIEIPGTAGSIVTKDRNTGFQHVLDSNKNIKLIIGPNANYVRADAVTVMQDLLQAHPDVKAVYAENDDMAMGALQVLEKNGRSDVKVASIDGLMESVKEIAKGHQYIATMLNDPVHEGQVAVETALKVADGESVPDFVDVGTALIDHNNAAKYISNSVFAPTVK